MNGRNAIAELGRKEDCVLYEAQGLPSIRDGDVLPADLRAFYAACGGLAFSRARIRVVAPDRFLPLDEPPGGEDGRDGAHRSRYLLAEAEGSAEAARISIDLGREHGGRCYASAPGRDGAEIVALSFTAFLARLAREGRFWT